MLEQKTIPRLLFTLMLFAAAALAGCGENSSPTAVTDANGKPATADMPRPAPPAARAIRPTVALVMKTLTNPFFIEMERGAREAERELDVKLLVRTAAQETSIEQQIQIVDALIHDGVDAIVIAPGDSLELIPVLKNAQDAGIVVVNIDNRLDPGFSEKLGLRNVAYISVDNEQGAYNAVSYLNRFITRPTAVAIIEGIRGASNAEERKRGALRAFSENPNATVVAMETAHWKIDEGYTVAADLLRAYPDIGALFCANDMMALGAVRYLRESGRQDVLVAGYDALQEAQESIREGHLLATVDQQAALQGKLGVEYAVRALQGESFPPVTLVDTRLINRDTPDRQAP